MSIEQTNRDLKILELFTRELIRMGIQFSQQPPDVRQAALEIVQRGEAKKFQGRTDPHARAVLTLARSANLVGQLSPDDQIRVQHMIAEKLRTQIQAVPRHEISQDQKPDRNGRKPGNTARKLGVIVNGLVDLAADLIKINAQVGRSVPRTRSFNIQTPRDYSRVKSTENQFDVWLREGRCDSEIDVFGGWYSEGH